MLPQDRLFQIVQRFEYLEAVLNAGPAPDEIAAISREYAELKPEVTQIAEWRDAQDAIHEAQAYETRPVDTEDFGSVLLRFDDGSKGSFMVSQVSAGRKNRLAVEINGSLCSLAWDQEVPQRLWIGHREQPDRLLSDDPSLLRPEIADSAHYPGGHIEGWPDAFKNMMGHFYQAVRAGKMPEAGARRFAAFDDGADVMYIIEAIVKSHQQQRWVSVER